MRTISMRIVGILAATAASLLVAAPSRASFVTPVSIPWTVGTANSTYQEWEAFTSVSGPNAPDVGTYINPNGTPNTYDSTYLTDGAFLTGGGNIYSFAAPTNPISIIPNFGLGAGYTTTIILHIKTLGTILDVGSVSLSSSDGASGVPPTSSALLYDNALGGFGGSDQERQFVWTVAGNAASYTLLMPASGSSLSLDTVRVDTLATLNPVAAVPEPASIVSMSLAVAGGAGWLGLRRLRRIVA